MIRRNPKETCRMRTRSRAGFTLIELMVSMTLTLVIMSILAQAFVIALDMFTGLKGIGDMQQNLRTATVLLRNDLGNDFFEGKRRLSDPTLISANAKIQAGFFALKQNSAVSVTVGASYYNEGTDLNAMPSFRAVDHFLYFTVKRKGNRQQDFFTTVLNDLTTPSTTTSPALNTFFSSTTAYNVGVNQLNNETLTNVYPPAPGSPQNLAFYGSQWAEVLYYLVRTGSTEEPNNPASIIGTPTFALYRAQFVMVPDSTNLVNKIGNVQFPIFGGMSCYPGTNGFLTFYSPQDAALPTNNRTFNPATFVSPTTMAAIDPRLPSASTLVLPNVISFQVQVMPAVGGTTFVDMPGSGLYDTTQFNVVGANTFGLKALQITMRVWDNKTRQARQATIVQDM